MKKEIIKYKGNKFILVGGAITTKDDFENGRVSYAHLYDNRDIIRYGEKIGEKKDIKFTGKRIEVNPKITTTELILKFLNEGGGWRY